MDLGQIIKFLEKLENKKIYYRLNKTRDDSIMVEVAVPGQRWEVEFFDDGHVEVEKYISEGQILDEKELDILFRDFSD